MLLSQVQKGQVATIKKIEASDTLVQLMEMGFLEGHSVIVDHIAPMGDPMAINVSGYVLSIRKADAATIWVEVSSQ
ncbi:ferrous iron transport protein A [Taibaiella sp. KBW10]|nr:ferrous iron transport protein A [Taibaiella sp. KBW10]